jgi:hypothetical protein
MHISNRWVSRLGLGSCWLMLACSSDPSGLGLGGTAGVSTNPGAGSGGVGSSMGGRTGAGASSGTPSAGTGASGGAATGLGGAGSNAGSSSAGSGNSPATGGANSAGAAGANTNPPPTSALIPARVRRLSNAEYDITVKKLLGANAKAALTAEFPPDLRQNGFTVNDAQRVDSVMVRSLAASAEALAAEARQNGTLAQLAPCQNTSQAETCARTFITNVGSRVHRRAPTSEETDALLGLYRVAAEGATYQDGVEHVLRGMLQSGSFLYLTELGSGAVATGNPLTLTQFEIASELSYLLTAAPPDQKLLDKANQGTLTDPAIREQEARRLLSEDAGAKERAVRLLREWLGVDRITETSKDALVYKNWESSKAAIVAESVDFPRRVVFESTGKLSELLAADWTVSTAPLSLYRAQGSGPISNSSKLTDRLGILNQAAFLSVYANAHESHPVLRGVAIARRVACIPVASPTTLNIQVVPPVPDPAKTTRERFDVHSTDDACKSCHRVLDPLGFSFEQFDGMGVFRSTENSKPINSAVQVSLSADFDGSFANSNELAQALANSAQVRDCFARNVFRAASASNDTSLKSTENAFIEDWRSNSAAAAGGIIETLITYVKSPLFTQRRVP